MSLHTTPKRRSQSQASIERTRKERKKNSNRIIAFCIIAFLIGYYILNYVSALEKPPIGATFNIVLGCTIMAVSLLIFIYTVKKQYFPKKKKRTKHVFLDDLDIPRNNEIKDESE